MSSSELTNETVVKKKKKWVIPVIIGCIALLLCAAIAGAIYFSSVAKPQKEFQKQLELGDKYLSDLDYDNAILAYRSAISINPKSADAYIGLANAYIGKEMYAEADEVLNEALRAITNATDIERIKQLQQEIQRKLAEEQNATEEEPIPEEETEEETEEESEILDLSSSEVGDIVTFGRYKTDQHPSKTSPIEWEILSKEDNRALLITRYVIEAYPWNFGESTNVTWENSDLREFLNNKFINTAFTETEREQIPIVTLHNPDNEYSGRAGGNDTQDCVFVLSVDEVLKYITPNHNGCYFPQEHRGFCEGLIIDTTVNIGVGAIYDFDYDDYWIQKGYSADVIGKRGACWWLRNPGYGRMKASIVDCWGRFGEYGEDDSLTGGIGVRPALWVEY